MREYGRERLISSLNRTSLLCSAAKLALFGVTLSSASAALAEPYPVGVNWNLFSLDPKFDSVLYKHNNPIAVPTIYEDIDSFDPDDFYSIWRNLSLVNATNVDKPTLRLQTFFVDPECESSCPGLDEVRMTISLETLSITDLSLSAPAVDFRFLGSNNRLSLDNADLRLESAPLFSGLAPLTIEFVGGESTIFNWQDKAKAEGYFISAPTTITVSPGAIGRFQGAGDKDADPSNILEAFRLTGPSVINVNGGTLLFEESFFIQENGTTNIRNGGQLIVTNNAPMVFLDTVNLTDTSILDIRAPGADSFRASKLNISDAAIWIPSGVVQIGEVTPSGTAVFAGTNDGAVFEFGGFLADNDRSSLISINNIDNMRIGSLFSGENETWNINNSTVSVHDLLAITGSSFNLSGRSALRLFTEPQGQGVGFGFPDFYGNFNFGVGSLLVVGEGVNLELSPQATLNFAAGSDIIINGTLSGNNNLGDARLFVETRDSRTGATTASLSPGGNQGNNIGRIITNGDVLFSGEARDLIKNSRYIVDLSVASGVTTNDELVYGAGTVDLSLLKDIYVRAVGNPIADDFEGAEFTIIRSLDAGSTGSIFLGGESLEIVEDPGLPALVDFTVADRRTNGNDDVTLVAVVQDVSSLTDHKSVKTDNAKSLVKAITSPTSGGGMLTSGATVSTALSSLTNSQLAQVSTIHAEPYSSFTTVGLERLHLLAGGVMDHAVGAGEFSGILRPNGEVREGRFWGQLTGVDGDVNGRDDLGNFGYQLGQVTVGMDALGGADRNLGFYLSMGSSSMDEHDIVDQELESEDVGLGVYGHRLLEGGWQVTGAFGIGFGKVESKRTMPVSIGSFTGGVASADYDTTSIYAAARMHRAFELGTTGGWVAYPSLGITYARTRSENIRESGGGDFNYEIAPATADSLVISPGLDLSRPFNMNSRPAALGVSVRYEYDPIADSTSAHEINVSSPLFGSFNQVGQNRGPHSVVVGLNSAMSLADGIQLGAGYEYSKHDHGEEHGLGINLTATW